MEHYYFIDDDIYFQNKKLPSRKVELFNVNINMNDKIYTGYDKDGNFYKLCFDEHELLIEKE